jgi:Aspartyl protease
MRQRILILLTISILLCALPAKAQHSVFPHPVAVLPFKYDGVHIVIHVTISPYSDTLNFIFDSGAEVNVLESSRAEEWDLKSDKEAGISGLSKGMTYQEIVNVDALNLGAASLPFQSFYVEDLSDLSTPGEHIDGIVGYQLLKNYTVKIDYIHHLLTLYEPGSFQYSSKGEVLPMGMNFFTPTIKVSLPFTNGITVEGVYHVTTGGDYGVLFNYPYVQKYHIEKALQMYGKPFTVQDVLKTIEYYNGIAVALTLGKYHLRNVPCSYSPDIDDGNPGEEIAGALGNNVWKNFTVILNYSQKEIYLEPNHPFGK